MDLCQVNRNWFLLMDCWSHEFIKHAMIGLNNLLFPTRYTGHKRVMPIDVQ